MMMNAPPATTGPLADFVGWAIAMLGGQVVATDGRWTLLASDDDVEFPFDQPIDPAELSHRPELLQWLARRLTHRSPLPCSVPRGDVQRVSELATHVYQPYEVADGNVRLAGCTLGNRFFFRETVLRVDGGECSLSHCWRDGQGAPVSDELRSRLGLDRLAPPPRPIPEHAIPPVPVDARSSGDRSQAGADTTHLLTTAVAVKWAEGKLEFVHGSQSVFLEFSGWAREISDSSVSLPPYTCPHTGRQGYRLVRTATGELTVQEAVGECALSGQTHLITNLATCVVSGLRVARDQLERCPISHELLLPHERTACRQCGERVSPLVIADQRCRACRQLEPVPLSDPRIVQITEAVPQARRLRRWTIAETDRVLIAVGKGWWHQWLLVLDRQTLALKRCAHRGRWKRSWTVDAGLPD